MIDDRFWADALFLLWRRLSAKESAPLSLSTSLNQVGQSARCWCHSSGGLKRMSSRLNGDDTPWWSWQKATPTPDDAEFTGFWASPKVPRIRDQVPGGGPHTRGYPHAGTWEAADRKARWTVVTR